MAEKLGSGERLLMSRISAVMGFFLVPAFSVVTPLLAIPAITAMYGATGWSAVAVGLAIGAIASTVIELGWGWNGPARAARASPSALPRVWATALMTRSAAALVATPPAALLAYYLAPGHQVTALLTAIGTSLIGLSPSWLYIGLGRPWSLITIEMVPRALGAATAAVMIYASQPLIFYPLIAVVAPALITQCLTLAQIRAGRASFRGVTHRRVLHAIRRQRKIALARIASSVYTQSPVVIVTAVASVGTAAAYAAGDRLMRMTLTGLAPVPSISQRWVNSPPETAERWRRAKLAIGANAAVGGLVGLVFALCSPLLLSIIFSGVVGVTAFQALLIGAIILVVCTSRATGGLGLVVISGDRALLTSALVGAASGILTIPLLTLWFGTDGAFIGVLTSESAVLLTQFITLRTHTRRTGN
ncbi:hypothetical protein Q9S78_14060 [Microbacterium sp. KSW-18]|uniref:Polysaccharide biosynthesis protein n=1 Tax=Microbacterium aquilitoris TaxID=3067307 RepID=A0ABU3GM55_9MICO|nr:hypothetical protein [Microbacterium sp. KSW-18]MDT3331792.1 hypothetical protein [Microbacterium sp. KSW-18]